MHEDQQRLLASLEQARRSLLESIQGLDERTATSATVFGDWTIKDLLGHLVAWGDELRSEIREIVIHPAPRYRYVISSQDDYDQWNRRQIAQKRSLSLPEILAELDRDYQQTVALIQRLAPDQLQRRGVVPWRIEQLPPPEEVTPATSMSVAGLLEIHIRHVNEHAEDIKRLHNTSGQPPRA